MSHNGGLKRFVLQGFRVEQTCQFAPFCLDINYGLTITKIEGSLNIYNSPITIEKSEFVRFYLNVSAYSIMAKWSGLAFSPSLAGRII
jgi:hypothetical protein